MSPPKATYSPAARCVALAISMVVIALGAYFIYHDYAPGRFTRFGYTGELSGSQAEQYGSIVLLLGCIPLLVFCKTSRQATAFGSILGILLLALIFFSAYA